MLKGMKHLWRFLILFVFLSTSVAMARVTRPGSSSSSSDRYDSSSLWGQRHFFSVVLDQWKYEEPGLMQDSGLLYGINYAFKDVSGSFYYEANLEYLMGKTEYDGALNNGTPYVHDSNNRILMGQLWAGVQSDQGSFGFIPKVGILFRRLVDQDDEASGDYQRDQDYFAIPVGLDLIFPTGTGRLALTGFVTLAFKGVNKTHFEDVGGANNPKFDQDDGRGFEAGISYLQGQWHGGFFVRTWKVDDSDTELVTFPANPAFDGQYLEPENETLSFGFKGGVAF